MRWGYVIPRVIIVAIVWAFFAFGFDPLIRFSMVQSGQMVAGAKVDIDDVTTKFFPPDTRLRTVAIANPSDPMTNLIEFESLNVDLSGSALLRRSYIIKDATIEGLKFGTPRATSGQLDDVPPPDSTGLGWSLSEKLKQRAAEFGAQWLDGVVLKLEEQLDPGQFESVRMAESMHADWTQRFDSLEAQLKNYEHRIKALEDRIKNAGDNPIERIQMYQESAQEIQNLLREAQQLRQKLNTLAGRARGDFDQLNAARQQDLDDIRNRINDFKLDAESISRQLLGPELQQQLTEAAEWIEFIQKYAKAFSDTPEPERFRGRMVLFPMEKPLPKFAIKRLKLSGEIDIDGEPIAYQGVATGITSDPKTLDEPMIVEIHSQGDQGVYIQGIVDLRPEKPIQDWHLTFTTPRPGEYLLGDAEKLTLNVTAGHTQCIGHVRIVGEDLTGRVSLTLNNMDIKPTISESVQPEVSGAIESAVKSVQQLTANVDLSGTVKDPSWKVQSNLGDQLAHGMEKYAAKQIAAQKEKLVQQADAQITERVNKLQSSLNTRYGAVLSDLNLQEDLAKKFLQKVAAGDRLPGNLDLNRLFRR